MNLERPDLTYVPAEVVAYIEALEMALLQARNGERPSRAAAAVTEPDQVELSEPPTTINLITVSRSGVAKRTPRHFYSRQRRSGMGVFDLETPEDDPPALLTLVDESQFLLLFTTAGRAFRLPATALPEAAVRARGHSLPEKLPFRLGSDERLAAVLPDQAGPYLILASQQGWVRRIRSSYFGPRMMDGISFHDVKEGGPLTAACWSDGTGDLFMVTEQGLAIRFNEAQVPSRGCRGLRVTPDDAVVAVTAVSETSGVFLLSHDGKGTIRLMSGFSANKAPGAGGKVAIKTDRLVSAFTVAESDDIFAISRLGKVIRFAANEIPAKEGVVQGVHCLTLRADEAVAAVRASLP
jgi:DNA gyrase subunit A